MIKIKSFTEIFTTDEDKKAFVKLLDMLFCRRRLNTDVISCARSHLQERSTRKQYARAVNDTYEIVSINTDATESGDSVDALSQSTGIDKLTLYDLYFRRLSAKHSVHNPSLLTDGIQKMLECKTADELNALGIKTFGDEWPVSTNASETLTTLRGKSTGEYKVAFQGDEYDIPLFSSPMPYPELYKDVPKDDLSMYASDLVIALVMLFSTHEDEWRGHNTTPLWSAKDNKLLSNIILKGEDSTEFSTDYVRNKLKPFEHLLFLCLVELRRSEACDSVPKAALDALELGEYMLDHGFGEEYIHMALHCNCWGTASYKYITNLSGDKFIRGYVRGVGMWTCTLHIDATFTEHYSLQNTSVVKNILVPLIKEKPIQSCIVEDISFRLSPNGQAETESCALLDISLQDALTKKAMLAILMQDDLESDPEDIPKCRITCRGALPLFYAGCASDWGYDIINGDAGYRCYRGFKSVGSIISNPAFNPRDINDDKLLVPGRDVIDGLPVLLQLQALCEGFFYMDSSMALLEDRLIHPHGLGLEQTELGRSVLDGTSKLILAIYPGKVYDLGIYLSAGLKPALIFIEHDISVDKYFLCVETEEQKKAIEDIVREVMKNSDRKQVELNCLIHVCGRTTDEVWMAGSTFFKCEPVMSSDLSDSPGTLTHELLCQTTLLSIMALKHLDSLLDSSDKDACRKVLTALENSSTCADIEMVLCAATETDNQMKEYASDNIDLEEHFVCATGDATPDVDGGDAFQGHIMRRRGHCYISTACMRLNLDGTLNVEIPTKGIYFVSICDGIKGAFYVSDGYMKMLTLTELQGLVPSVVPICNDIIGMNTQEKKRLCVSLRDACNDNTIFEEE